MMNNLFPVSTRRLAVLLLGLFLFSCASQLSGAAAPEEREQWLAAHNRYRRLHGVPAVVWSDRVAASAMAYALSCPSGHSGTDYGENLSWASYDMGVQTVVDGWYAEEADYDYNNPGYVKGTGHFSQVIWKGTRAIGCARVTGCGPEHSLRANTWVCQYSPAGNYVSQFEENVLPPLPSR